MTLLSSELTRLSCSSRRQRAKLISRSMLSALMPFESSLLASSGISNSRLFASAPLGCKLPTLRTFALQLIAHGDRGPPAGALLD